MHVILYRLINSTQNFTNLIELPVNATSTLLSGNNFAIFVTVAQSDMSGMFTSQFIRALFGTDVNSINFNDGNIVFTEESNQDDTASVLVSSELLEEFQDTAFNITSDPFPRLSAILYGINNSLFQDQNLTSTEEVGSIVFSFSRSILQGPPPFNLSDPVRFSFLTGQVS